MKALVVGGNGFIGSHLVDRLVADDWEVSILHKYEQRRFGTVPEKVKQFRGDLTQESLVEEALDGVQSVLGSVAVIENYDPSDAPSFLQSVQKEVTSVGGLVVAAIRGQLRPPFHHRDHIK